MGLYEHVKRLTFQLHDIFQCKTTTQYKINKMTFSMLTLSNTKSETIPEQLKFMHV